MFEDYLTDLSFYFSSLTLVPFAMLKFIVKSVHGYLPIIEKHIEF